MPLLNIEQLWADYCAFEKSVNSALADRLISERNREYTHAKKVTKQLEAAQRGLQVCAYSLRWLIFFCVAEKCRERAAIRRRVDRGETVRIVEEIHSLGEGKSTTNWQCGAAGEERSVHLLVFPL